MRKYEALDTRGRIFAFREKSDTLAKAFVINNHYKSLIRVKSYPQAGYMYTILDYKKTGY